jgi:hypothetical protein
MEHTTEALGALQQRVRDLETALFYQRQRTEVAEARARALEVYDWQQKLSALNAEQHVSPIAWMGS